MRRPAELTNRRFGKLVALTLESKDKWGKSMWRCQCDCGNTSLVSGGNLMSGTTTACGCVRRERSTVHGEYRSRTYHAWQSVRAKVKQMKLPNYPEWATYIGFKASVGDKPENSTLTPRDPSEPLGPNNFMWKERKSASSN